MHRKTGSEIKEVANKLLACCSQHVVLCVFVLSFPYLKITRKLIKKIALFVVGIKTNKVQFCVSFCQNSTEQRTTGPHMAPEPQLADPCTTL